MPDNSSNNKKIAKNTLFLYLRMIFVLLVSIYTTRVVLNVLGVIDYGIYNVVAGFVSMFAFLKNAMTIGIQRYFNYEKGRENGYSLTKVYNTSLQIQLIVGAFLFLLLETVGLWYINNIMVIPQERLFAANFVFQTSVISLLVLVIEVPYLAAVMAYERMDYYAIVSIFEVVFRLLIVIILPFISFDKLIFYGFLSLGVSIIDLLLYFIYCKHCFKELHIEMRYEKQLFKSMLTFSGYNTLDMFAYTAKNQGVNVLMNYFFGPVINAARGVASQVMGAMQGFSNNIVTSFRPQIVESYAKGNSLRTQNLMFSLSKISYIMLYFLCVPVIINIESILHIWLGNNVPEYTTIFIVLTLVDMVLSSLNTPVSIVAQATGDIRYYQIVRSVIITSTLLFSYVGLQIGLPAVSVYWISIIIVVINQPVSLFLLKKTFPFDMRQYFRLVIVPCLVFSVLSPIAPILVSRYIPNNLFGIILSVITSMTFSIVIAYYLCLNNKEKGVITTFLRNKLKK